MKTALVTGANRGLGWGLCTVLSAKGYRVFAGMRNTSGFSAGSGSIIPITLDVRSDESIQQAAETVRQSGSLDVLINNAGINKDSATAGHKELVSDLNSLDRASLLTMFDVNAVAPVMLAKYFLPLLTADPSYIINVSSERASLQNTSPSANYGYRASKVALNMFTKALVHDLPDTVRTFAVHPGGVTSGMNPNGPLAPEQAATSILAILDNWSDDKNGAFLDNEGRFFSL